MQNLAQAILNINPKSRMCDPQVRFREKGGGATRHPYSARNGELPPGASGEKGVLPDPEVAPQAQRRRFSAAYKARIVREADTCTQPGEIGALLRREGLYSSCLTEWRKVYRRGAQAALAADRRGRKPKQTESEKENERLRKQLVRTEEELRQAKLILEAQKKFQRSWESPSLRGRRTRTTDASGSRPVIDGSGGPRLCEFGGPARVVLPLEAAARHAASTGGTSSVPPGIDGIRTAAGVGGAPCGAVRGSKPGGSVRRPTG